MSFKYFRPAIRGHGPNCKCSLDFGGCVIKKLIEKLERFEEQNK